MTSPARPGRPSPLRVGGLALLGVGIIAGIIGVASLLMGGEGEGDGEGETAAPGPSASVTSSAATTEPTGTTAPTSGSPVPEPLPSPGATGTTGVAAPPAAPGAPAPGPGGSGGGGAGAGDAGNGGDTKVAVRAPLRVYNNSLIIGLATVAADDFRSQGWPVTEVANYPSGIIPTSTVYYQPGTDEKAPADALGSEFGLRVEPRFEGIRNAAPGVIVIVTNDYQGR